jgi:hypothetical protein
MAQKYDRYRNVKRAGESLVLKANDKFPEGSTPQEWEKIATVEESGLSKLEREEIAKKGHSYIKTKVEVKISETSVPPKPQKH